MATNNRLTPDGSLRQVRRLPFILFGIAAVLSQTGLKYKVIPGGPFISVVGEALPIMLFVVSIVLSLFEFRRAPVSVKVVLWLMSLLSAGDIGVLIDGIIRFWSRPSARGDLFGL